MDNLLALYFALPHDRSLGIFTKAFNRIIAKVLKRILDRTVPYYFLKTQHRYPIGLNTEFRNKKVVVSMTSFPARIDEVWIAIECLLRQSFKPDKVILWLSLEQFPDKKIPESLARLIDRGLTISFVKEDLKSHKKYIYALQQFPNDYIITVDDDLYYDSGILENLILMKKKYPQSVVTNRGHAIQFAENGSILPYRKWHHNVTKEEPSLNLVQTGGFGTLYEFGDLHKSSSDTTLIKEKIPFADDLWLKVQTILMNKKVVTNQRYNKDPITIKSSQLEKLVNNNVLSGGNDVQFSSILQYFNIDQRKFKS